MTTRTLVWQAMFEAETRMRYFYARAGQFQRSDNVLHILLMLFSSATFLSLLGVVSLPAQARLTAACAAVATLLSVSAAVLKLGVQAKDHATAGAEMGRVLDELKMLWAAFENGSLSDMEASDRLSALKERSGTAGQPLATTRVRRKLLLTCYHDTERMAGAYV